jgi:hypothetical protein
MMPMTAARRRHDGIKRTVFLLYTVREAKKIRAVSRKFGSFCGIFQTVAPTGPLSRNIGALRRIFFVHDAVLPASDWIENG